MNWGNLNVLFLLLLIPVFVLLLALAGFRRRKRFLNFAEAQFFRFFFKDFSSFHWILKKVLILTAISFLILAAAKPRWGRETQVVTKEGLDIAICIDVSKSMEATDIRPNRLQRAKDHISLFIDQLAGDRIAIIPFAGEAFVQLPLTDDYQIAKVFLGLLDTDTVPVPGTNIGYALETAANTFQDSDRNRVIVLISDGEDLGQEGLEMAKRIAEDGIVIHTLGVGSLEGSPIPIQLPNGNIEYAQDTDGNIVITRLDANTLHQVADASGGLFFPITPNQAEIFEILREIETLEREKFESREYVRHRERYHIFAVIAFFLLMLEAFILTRKRVSAMRSL